MKTDSKQDDVPAPDLAPESIQRARRSPRIHQEDRYDPCLQSDEDEEELDDAHPLPSSQPDTLENEKTKKTQEDAKMPTTFTQTSKYPEPIGDPHDDPFYVNTADFTSDSSDGEDDNQELMPSSPPR